MLFRLKALGSLVVEGRDGPLAGSAVQRRTVALLVLLAAARERGISRDKLIGLLWPDTSDERARHNFTQSLYRLRQEFGPDAVDGNDVLRLNRGVFVADFAEFEDLVRREELEPAAALYGGAFMDGFFLPASPEFERWMEHERARLAGIHRNVLERLATEAARAGAAGRAVEWWRALAGVDPLNSRIAARLVEALVTAGDRHGALQYARVHESLVKQELDTAPGPEFLAAIVAARDAAAAPSPPRQEAAAAIPPPPPPPPPPPSPSDIVASGAIEETSANRGFFAHTSETLRVAIPRRIFRVAIALAGVASLTAAVLAYTALGTPANTTRIVAVGHIADFTGGDTTATARLLPEMLTTNLGRLEGIVVVNRTRLHELLRPRTGNELEGSDFARAAQLAGVDELLDGALYRRPDGTLRIDLRVLDLRSGQVRQVHQAEATDPFALADSATVRIAAGFGVPLSDALRVRDVTTSSLVAYGLYEEGLRALRQHDHGGARRLFDAALASDSVFAMAEFGAFLASGDIARIERAVQLANRVTDKERLVIRATWASGFDHPSHVAIAETLAARYPSDPESHLELAGALHKYGDFAGALRAARQAFAMDSASVRTNAPRCLGCEALALTFWSYFLLDSIDAAERTAREWLARSPSSPLAWRSLRELLAGRADSAGALDAYERMRVAMPAPFDDWEWIAAMAIRTGDFDKAERLLARVAESGTSDTRAEALWWLTISQRHRGRLADALTSVDRLQRLSADGVFLLLRGQVLFEMGRFREAATSFRARVREVTARHRGSNRARHVTWALTHEAAATAAAGDMRKLELLADSIRTLGSQSGYGRDRGLHHHVRGLILASRGRKEEAVAEFRLAIWSPVAGYTRTNFELGRLLIELGRPHEAIPVLRAALAGGLEASNLYVTHTELRALLARAYAATHQADSAASHRRWVAHAMIGADSMARVRIEQLLTPPDPQAEALGEPRPK